MKQVSRKPSWVKLIGIVLGLLVLAVVAAIVLGAFQTPFPAM